MFRPAPSTSTETIDMEASGSRRRDPSVEIELDALRTTGEMIAELPPLMRFAGYEILGRIAVGGMAEVFLARERGEAGSTRQVALKIIQPQLAADPDFAELFMREGKVALGIRHPNVCHVYRFGMEHGHPFLAMELVHGITVRDLHTRVRRLGKPIPIAIATKIVANVAEALHSAHVARDERGYSLGIVHQDVSPHNVMIAYDGTVKLLDFGVASTSNERAIEAAESSHSTIRGKAGYLSPEQCTGAPLDARSDVFALGIVFYEMLTGARLFARPKSVDSIRAIACEPLSPWPESIPAPLARVLDRALARDPVARYPSAAAMQEDLERTLAESRTAITSAKIADELKRILGDDFGRPPKVETSSEVVAWLRSSEKEKEKSPTPHLAPSPAMESDIAPGAQKNPIARLVTIGVVGIVVLALTALGIFKAFEGAPNAQELDMAGTTLLEQRMLEQRMPNQRMRDQNTLDQTMPNQRVISETVPGGTPGAMAVPTIAQRTAPTVATSTTESRASQTDETRSVPSSRSRSSIRRESTPSFVESEPAVRPRPAAPPAPEHAASTDFVDDPGF